MNENLRLQQVERQRRELLLRLSAHRELIGQALARHRRGGLPTKLSPDFPRSQTMRLILSEPLLMMGISAVAARLLSRRLPALLPALLAVGRIGHRAWLERPPLSSRH